MKAYTYRLVREKTAEYNYRGIVTNTDEASVRLLNEIFDAQNLPEEHAFVIAMDAKTHVVGVFDFSHGTANASLVSPKDVLKRVLLSDAIAFVFAHNHPSGDPTPSVQDRQITKKLKASAEVMDVTMLGSLVIGDNTYERVE